MLSRRLLSSNSPVQAVVRVATGCARPSRHYSGSHLQRSRNGFNASNSPSHLPSKANVRPSLRFPISAIATSATSFRSISSSSTPSDAAATSSANIPSTYIPSTPPQSTPSTDDLFSDAWDPHIPVEYIGYLKDIGLSHGIGPTACIQWLLEHVHIWGGLPWATTIIVSAILVRSAMIPFYLRLQDNGARMQRMQPMMRPVTEAYARAQKEGDMNAMHTHKLQLSQLKKDFGVSMKPYLVIPAQMMIFFGFFRSTRLMSQFPVESMKTQGVLWFPDLTVMDPFYLLPCIAAGAQVLSVKFSSEAPGVNMDNNPVMKRWKPYIQWGLPALALTFYIATSLPAAPLLFFATSAVWTIIQGFILRSEKVRKWFKITEPTPPKIETPPASLTAENVASGLWPGAAKAGATNTTAKGGAIMDVLMPGAGSKGVMAGTKDSMAKRRLELYEKEAKERDLKKSKEIRKKLGYRD